MRDILRNIVLNYLPASLAHRINVAKNLRVSFLEAEMAHLPQLLAGNADRAALDVGANLGLYCELLAPLFREVIAVEPQPKLVEYLRKVVPRNVRVVQKAASDHDGQANLIIPVMSGLTRTAAQQDALASLERLKRTGDGGKATTISVEVSTIDAIAAGADVGFIKIDVEGHETAAVAGALKTVERCRPILLIEIARQTNEKAAAVFEMLAERGYRAAYVKGRDFVAVSPADLERLQSDADYEAMMRHSPDHHYVINFFFFHESFKIP